MKKQIYSFLASVCIILALIVASVNQVEVKRNQLQVEANNYSTPTPTFIPLHNGTFSRVIKVIDGDTIEIDGGERVKYVGIEAPDLVGNNICFGSEAYEANKQMVEGKIVELEEDTVNINQNNVLLRYVWLGDELINEKLVLEGFAHSYTDPANIKYQQKFIDADRLALTQNKGIWQKCELYQNPLFKHNKQ